VVIGRTHIGAMDVYSAVCAVQNLWRDCAPHPMSKMRKNVAVSGQSRIPDIFILFSTAFSY